MVIINEAGEREIHPKLQQSVLYSVLSVGAVINYFR
jgi:hypothetical protein